MKRSEFVKILGGGAMGAAVAPVACTASGQKESTAQKSTKPILMKVGCQSGGTSEENLQFKARHGVFNIDGGAPKMIEGKGWDLEDSLRKREACEKYGISLDAYHWALPSSGIDKVPFPNVMLGKSPERDREIEMLQ